MSNAEEIQQVEMTIEQAKTLIARRDALARLERNKDFHDLVLEGFLKDHVIRSVMLKGHPQFIGDDKHQSIFDNQLTGAGALKQFFVNIFTEGMNAEQALRADEQTLQELHAENLAEGQH